MAYLLGIDLGTSSAKAVLIDGDGNLQAVCQQAYSFDIPAEGWAEQAPQVWWNAVVDTVRGVLEKSGIMPLEIDGIGFSGQMHGMVALDKNGKPVRKAIIWCDQRSAPQVEEIRSLIGEQQLGEVACNRVAAGFQTASLLWMKEEEPQAYKNTHLVILPKDYIRYRLTGELSTDVTDAAGTLALDVRRGKWSDDLIRILGLRQDLYPPIFLPESPAGTVTAEAAGEIGLAPGTKVFHGGADQVMQAIGNGIIKPGRVSVTIGTGAQVFAPLSGLTYDPKLRSHTFNNYYQGGWYFMGATLSGGLSLRWLRDVVLNGMPYEEMNCLASSIPRGSEGLIYLPYMAGERTPHMDPYARGMFFGLTLNHGRAHLIRAVMEGVVFSLRDCLNIFYGLGQDCVQVIASGGGARSAPWLQMQADIFNREVRISRMPEQAAVGAAISAGVGAGIYANYEEACDAVIKWSKVPYLPNPAGVKRYEEYYQLFSELYPANREAMHKCTALSRKHE